jgi:hypothetical protein
MKSENTDKKMRLNGLRKALPLLKMLLIITALLSSGYDDSDYKNKNSDLWEPINIVNRSSRDADNAEAIERKIENITEVFRKALPFNPPKGFAVMPRLQYLSPLDLPGNSHSPEPVHFRVAVRMPPQSKDIVAGVNVWINDPYNLLDAPVLSDSESEMFLLPPEVGSMGGQKIVSRMAHPPGYDSEYPCTSIFPLWSDDQEPFLRSVVRPSFGLARSTVTTLYTAGDRPFWKPVSQERWINAMIAKAEMTVNEITAGVDAADELNITEEQMNRMKIYLTQMKEMVDEENIIKRSGELKDGLMLQYEMMKRSHPDLAKEFYQKSVVGLEEMLEMELSQADERRKEIEEMEQKLMSALVQREVVWQQMKSAIDRGDWEKIDELADEHKLDNLRLIADAGRSVGRLRAELAGLSPAERRAPAYGFLLPDDHPLGTQRQVVAMVFNAERASGLMPAGAKGARAIVSIDSDFFNFFDKGAPIRMMAIEYWGRNTVMYDNNRRNLLDDIWEHLDWQGLKAMVR